ncbi:MAG: hypothetical protein AAFX80_22900, partial [Cyanobacteria bacterium J06639_18]
PQLWGKQTSQSPPVLGAGGQNHPNIDATPKIKNIQITRGAPPCTPTDQKLWNQLFFGNS